MMCESRYMRLLLSRVAAYAPGEELHAGTLSTRRLHASDSPTLFRRLGLRLAPSQDPRHRLLPTSLSL